MKLRGEAVKELNGSRMTERPEGAVGRVVYLSTKHDQ
jgi:hypothetical protein